MLGPPHFHFASDATAFFKCIPYDVIYIHPLVYHFFQIQWFRKRSQNGRIILTQQPVQYRSTRQNESKKMTDVTSATFWMKVRYDIDQVNYLLKYEILDRQ